MTKEHGRIHAPLDDRTSGIDHEGPVDEGDVQVSVAVELGRAGVCPPDTIGDADPPGTEVMPDRAEALPVHGLEPEGLAGQGVGVLVVLLEIIRIRFDQPEAVGHLGIGQPGQFRTAIVVEGRDRGFVPVVHLNVADGLIVIEEDDPLRKDSAITVANHVLTVVIAGLRGCSRAGRRLTRIMHVRLLVGAAEGAVTWGVEVGEVLRQALGEGQRLRPAVLAQHDPDHLQVLANANLVVLGHRKAQPVHSRQVGDLPHLGGRQLVRAGLPLALRHPGHAFPQRLEPRLPGGPPIARGAVGHRLIVRRRRGLTRAVHVLLLAGSAEHPAGFVAVGTIGVTTSSIRRQRTTFRQHLPDGIR
ncbi:hypothetical protein, partial [Saccharopolyspora shandongensis]|uniref:hypothetical protein n=1 Tax=Saccharopolyspora shandongensis TaxID=418495 RepID=UPI0033C31336